MLAGPLRPGQLVLACVLPATLASVLGVWLVRQTVEVRGDAEAQARLDVAEAHVRELMARRRTALEATARTLAAPDGALVGPTVAELVKGGGRLSALARAELRERAAWIVRPLDLDVVALATAQGRVLVAPHAPEQTGDVEPLFAALAGGDGHATLTWIDARGSGVPVRLLAEVVVVEIEAAGVHLELLVARDLEGLAGAHGGGLGVRQLDALGQPIAGTTAPTLGATRRTIALADRAGATIAFIEVSVPVGAHAELLRALAVRGGVVVLISSVLAGLLGLALARRVGRDARMLSTRADERATAQMTAELADSRTRLRQAERLAAWQEIARALAHELKNPLTPIRLSVETLRKAHATAHPSFPELFDESTRTILQEVQRMEKSLREFADFARLPRRERQLLALNEVVGGALALYKGAVRVVEELAPGLPPVDADRDQLTQVVLNLLENARDAVALRGTEQTVGRIHVCTRVAPGGVTLEVRDNGPGFDDRTAEQLFTPYFTTKAQGTGLGLAIVQRIVVEHGGTITARGVPGEGATFVVELPLRGGVTDTVPVMPPPARP